MSRRQRTAPNTSDRDDKSSTISTACRSSTSTRPALACSSSAASLRLCRYRNTLGYRDGTMMLLGDAKTIDGRRSSMHGSMIRPCLESLHMERRQGLLGFLFRTVQTRSRLNGTSPLKVRGTRIRGFGTFLADGQKHEPCSAGTAEQGGEAGRWQGPGDHQPHIIRMGPAPVPGSGGDPAPLARGIRMGRNRMPARPSIARAGSPDRQPVMCWLT